MKRALWTLVLILGLSARLHGQQLPDVDANSVYLGSAACRLLSGSGSPEGAVTGNVCYVYIRSDTGDVYKKTSGTGNTGWSIGYRAGGTDVPVADGGTGVSTLASNGVLYGNGTGAVQVTGAGPSNSVLTANGGAPSFSATPTVTSLTGTTSLTTPTVTAAANLTISPTGDVVFDPTGNDVLPNANYDINLGMLSKKYLTLHAAELWVETLVAQNTLATIGGRVLVAPTNILTQDLTTGATAMTVKYNNLSGGGGGDVVYMESDGKVEFLRVTGFQGGSAGAYVYNVTRNLDGSGANDWFAGDAVLNTGDTGDGFIDLYSLSGVLSGSGPTIVGNVRTGTAYNAIAPRWAIGNLNGLYGYGADTYGSAFGDASTANITIDATNGLRIRNSTTNLLQADISGNLKIGDPSGNRLVWDGSNLVVVSNTVSLLSTGVTVAVASSATPVYTAANGYTFAGAAGDMGMTGSDSPANPLAQQSLWLKSNATGHRANITIESQGDIIGLGYNAGSPAAGVRFSSASDVWSLSTFHVGGAGGGSGVLVVDAANGNTALSNSAGLGWGNRSVQFVGDSSSNVLGVSVGGNEVMRWDSNGALIPSADNTRSVGIAATRFALVRAVTITPGDLSFENGWTFTESYKVGIDEPGLAVLDENNELVYFLGKTGFRRRGAGTPSEDADALPYVKTTAAERVLMDAHPELRVAGYLEDGTPLFRTKAEKPMPDPKTGKTNTQRKVEGAALIKKPGGQQ